MQQRRPRSAERQIDISFIGMNHLFDTPAPYDSVTIDHLNLEPHRGGYRPRYDDEVLIAETNAQMRPFGCIAAGNHLFFLPRFFLKTAPQPETKPLEWFYYTLRGNAAYIPIDDNVLLSVRYLGTVVSWDSANNKLTLKSDTDDIFMEEKGGFILANRNVYRFSSATLNPDGSLVLDGVTPVLAPYASTAFLTGTPIVWVSRNRVEPPPTIQSVRYVVNSDTMSGTDFFSFFSPVVASSDPLSPTLTASNLYLGSHASPLPFPVYNPGTPPKAYESNPRRDIGSIHYGRGATIYGHPNGGGNWTGLSHADVSFPKWVAIPSTPYSILSGYTHILNENFSAGAVPDWFRPYYRRDGYGGSESAWRRYSSETASDINDIVNFSEQQAALVYSPFIPNGNGIRTGDWNMRFLRTPPRVRHTLGASFYDEKGGTDNNSVYEMGLIAPYRSLHAGQFALPRFYGLTPCADIYTAEGKPWCYFKADGAPLTQLEDNGSSNIFRPPTGVLAYGFKTLKTGDEKYMIFASRAICGDQPRFARVLFRFIDPTFFGTSIGVRIEPDRTTNLAAKIRTYANTVYTTDFTTKLVTGDRTSITSSYYTDSNDPNNLEPRRYYYSVPLAQVRAVDISGITDEYRVLTIPRLIIYNAASDTLQESLSCYVVKGSYDNPSSPSTVYVPVFPLEDELVAAEIISIGKIRVEKQVGALSGHEYLVTTLEAENVKIRIPKNVASEPYVGFEFRVLTPGLARERPNGAPRQHLPGVPREAALCADGEDFPLYTTLELWTNTYKGASNAASKSCYESFLRLAPPEKETKTEERYSAVLLSGETWGRRGEIASVSGEGNELEFVVSIPSGVDTFNTALSLVIGRYTSSGLQVVHRVPLSASDIGTTKTIRIPASSADLAGIPMRFSETAPDYGNLVTDNYRIVLCGKTSAFVSHAGNGLSWKLLPSDETDAFIALLPNAPMLLTKYNGKPFFVSGSKAYALVTENAFLASFIQTGASVAVTPVYNTLNQQIFSNSINELLYTGEDGIYVGDEKVLAFTERLPETIFGIYLLDIGSTPVIVVEKDESADIYWNDKQTQGFIRWTVERDPNLNSTRRINQIFYYGGYLYLIAPDGFSAPPDAFAGAQVIRVGSGSNKVDVSRTRYISSTLRSPTGLRVRKIRLICVEPADLTTPNIVANVVFSRRPFGSSTNETITTIAMRANRTHHVKHKDMKLDGINITVLPQDGDAIPHHIELIAYPGVNW
jgi:hypothetical protein